MANIDFSEFDSLFGDTTTTETVKEENTNTATPVASIAEEPKEEIVIENVNAPLNPAMLQSAQAKMQQIAVEMNNLFVERDDLIKIMLLAITTGTNCLLLGPPGTARLDINA